MGNYLDFEKPLEELELKIHELRRLSDTEDAEAQGEIERLEKKAETLRSEIFSKLSRWQITLVARHPDRPYTLDYIAALSATPLEPSCKAIPTRVAGRTGHCFKQGPSPENSLLFLVQNLRA